MPGRKWRAAIKKIVDHAADVTLFDQAVSHWTSKQNMTISELLEDLFRIANYQGVSDTAASVWLRRNGIPNFRELAHEVQAADCPCLWSLEDFSGCDYQRRPSSCGQTAHYRNCVVPQLHTRRGLLAKTATGFALWARGREDLKLRDWLLCEASPDRTALDASNALSADFARVPGISVKVARMLLADMCIGLSGHNEQLLQVGVETIVVDRIVHNLIIRIGAIAHSGKSHAFGEGCYRPGGCADLIRDVASSINANLFDDRWPVCSPRLIQHALWRFGAGTQLNTCNGDQIPAGARCGLKGCPASGNCGRIAGVE